MIPHVLEGRDVLGIARTGSGKTAGFTLPMLQNLSTGRARARMPRALILEPTRELASQIEDHIVIHGKRHRLSHTLIIGGESFKDQLDGLRRGTDILIATPGRLLDLFERGQVLLADVRLFVIDEADRMLDMGFIPDIERITRLLPRRRQTLLFSATLPAEIRSLARAFLREPEEVYADAPARATASVDQEFERVANAHELRRRLEACLRGLGEDFGSVLIFCNRKMEVGEIQRRLVRGGYDSAILHGDLPQHLRTATLERFRGGEVKILICSDLAARGLDIPHVTHVINYGLPNSADDYVHRIGRTGRAGRRGHALTFVLEGDDERFEEIVKVLPSKPEVRVSGGERESRQSREPRRSREPRQSRESRQPQKPPRTRESRESQSGRSRRSSRPRSSGSGGDGSGLPAFLTKPIRR
ncbi:MAG: DEAD/DEAH box helicase [Alphaproteobacteria bacterium]|nr:DEAD/DEAH box helicase [Alphaproteobacteria bacterium]MDA7987707.1 DEAD/DEAH box helicase [Alphaproteobacteria bacterium]